MNVIAKRMIRTASLESELTEYLKGVSDDELCSIAKTISHYDVPLDFVENIRENNDEELNELLSGKTLSEAFKTAFDSHDQIDWYAEWIRVGDDGNIEFFNDVELGREARSYIDEMVEILSAGVTVEAYRDLPNALTDILDKE